MININLGSHTHTHTTHMDTHITPPPLIIKIGSSSEHVSVNTNARWIL